MNEEIRKELIPELDQLAEEADKLREELSNLIEQHQVHTYKWLAIASKNTRVAASSIAAASESLKRAGQEQIEEEVTNWYHFHHEEEEDPDAPDPVYESIKYERENRWVIVVSSPVHGRERIVYLSDASSQGQVYSCDPA